MNLLAIIGIRMELTKEAITDFMASDVWYFMVV